jgi:hypothetical protein
MQKPPLDPDVDDTAPTDAALTGTMSSTLSRTFVCSTPTRPEPTGERLPGSCCTLTLMVNLIVHDMLSIVTWPAPNG